MSSTRPTDGFIVSRVANAISRSVRRRYQQRPSQDNDSVRWTILLMTCLVLSGIYYSMDIPAALHSQLHDRMNAEQNFELYFNLLYTVYSFPNIVLPFVGGRLVDRCGAAVCLLTFASICCIGQVVFALGVAFKCWWLMLLGRTVYGLGGENSCVAYSTLLAQWFAGKEVAFAFGVALAIGRLGSVLNNLASPVVANTYSTVWALWVGACMNTSAVVLALCIRKLDDKHGKNTNDNPTEDNLEEPLLSSEELTAGEAMATEPETQSQSVQETLQPTQTRCLRWLPPFGVLFWILSLSCLVVYGCVLPWNNVASGILLERNYFQSPPEGCHLTFPDQCSAGSLVNYSNPAVDENGSSCSLPNTAPVLPTALNRTIDGKVIEYQPLRPSDVDCQESFWSKECTQDYCNSYHRATETAGRYMSIPYTLSACLSPFLGRLVDRIGHRAILATLAPTFLIAVHLTMALAPGSSPVLPLLGQGLSYALYSSVLWPSITLAVEASWTGTAFGVMTSIQNFGLALFPLLVAAIYNHAGGRYIPHVEIFFASCAACGLLLGIVLNFVDRSHGSILNAISERHSAAERTEVDESNNAELPEDT